MMILIIAEHKQLNQDGVIVKQSRSIQVVMKINFIGQREGHRHRSAGQWHGNRCEYAGCKGLHHETVLYQQRQCSLRGGKRSGKMNPEKEGIGFNMHGVVFPVIDFFQRIVIQFLAHHNA